ncbi:HlyD family type I secretion periplasmic adaptor subunit [Ectothiorhodospiraceae bacterium BW-2]|nr:HlyD family type I secretion periplasmic adaptor subunit [Ectothiorhodospiraceae bacterium BW-2]
MSYGHSSPSRLFLLGGGALIGVCLLWAALGSIDVVSHAPGVVTPEGQIKVVQHLEGGIVRHIEVEEGELIRRGQRLIELDPTRNRTEVDALTVQLESLQIKLARLTAEVEGKRRLSYDDRWRERYPQLVTEALKLFQRRQERLRSEVAVQQQLIIRHHHQLEEINSRLEGNQNVLIFLQQQIAMSDKLLESSLSNRMNHLDLLKEQSGVERQIAEDRALQKQMEAAVVEADRQMELINNRFIEQAQSDLDQELHKVQILQQKLTREQDTLQRTEVVAPVSGTIKRLYVTTEGGIIAPGGKIAEIVPQEAQLIIEARLPPGDIGYVIPGQKVLIRLASADSFRFNPLPGQVVQVSPDTLLTRDEQPYYKLKILPDTPFFARDEQYYPFFPGMLVDCTILTGERTVLDYLLQPFISISQQALRER